MTIFSSTWSHLLVQHIIGIWRGRLETPQKKSGHCAVWSSTCAIYDCPWWVYNLASYSSKCVMYDVIPIWQERSFLTLPHQVRPSDHRSDLDNMCVGSLYEKEGWEKHEYSLWRHRFTDCSVEVTLRSHCLGCLSWPGRRGVLNAYHIYVISRSPPVADNWIDEDEFSWLTIHLSVSVCYYCAIASRVLSHHIVDFLGSR